MVRSSESHESKAVKKIADLLCDVRLNKEVFATVMAEQDDHIQQEFIMLALAFMEESAIRYRTSETSHISEAVGSVSEHLDGSFKAFCVRKANEIKLGFSP